jgi:hypothetical protein
MSCCGRSTTAGAARVSTRGAPSRLAASVVPLAAYFRCTGQSTVTVVGPVSGKMYRFPSSGQIVAVDARDTMSLSRVPYLQNVRPR